MKYLLIMLLLLPVLLPAQTPIDYKKWQIEENKFGIQFGGMPANYYNEDSAKWVEIQTYWESWNKGYKAVNSKHRVYVDTLDDIIGFVIKDTIGNNHKLGMQVGPLFFFHKPSQDTVRIASSAMSGYSMSGDTVTVKNVYPQVNLLIINNPDGITHQLQFGAKADSALDAQWVALGSNQNVFVVNTFRFILDSLYGTLHDDEGQIDTSTAHDIVGQITFKALGKRIFSTRYSHVWQDTLTAPLYNRLHLFGGKLFLLEGYRMVDVVDWPDGGYKHNVTKTWDRPQVDTYLGSGSASSSYYTAATLSIYRSAGGTEYGQALFKFEDLIDSISAATTIDSATISLHYNGSAAGAVTVWIYRMITDGSWADADSLKCTYNSRYDNAAADSIAWAAGWGVHTSSYTVTNGASRAITDTLDNGYLEINIKDIITNIKTAETDYGLWGKSPAEYNRIYFDSNEDVGGDYPKLYIEYTTGEAPEEELLRRRRMMMN